MEKYKPQSLGNKDYIRWICLSEELHSIPRIPRSDPDINIAIFQNQMIIS
jgi:hypothetical protein